MRLIEIRRVYAPSTGSPTVANTTVPLPPAVKATLTGAFTPVAAVRTELWLGAVDGQGGGTTRYLAAPWWREVGGGGCEIRTHGPLRAGSFQDCWVKPLPKPPLT